MRSQPNRPSPLPVAVCLLFAFLLALPAAAQTSQRPAEKRDAPSNRLLVPYFLVDTMNPSGTTTLWSLRNESLLDVTVTIDYYEADSPQAPQRTDQIVLGGKEIRTGNIRDVANLEVDPDGFSRGYVIFSTDAEPGILYGDTFFITPGDDFAEGSLMVDASDGVDADLCNLFTLRFLNGGAFGGITEMVVWLETDSLPLEAGAVVYSVYDGEGNLEVTNELFLDRVTTRFDVSSLLPGQFVDGAVEIQFAQGLRGHVSLAMSATGRYSVGFDAVCKG